MTDYRILEWVVTLLGIAYPWSLYGLSLVGFAAPDKHSISGFISTPGATGAMAVATAGPIWIILNFERRIREYRRLALGVTPVFGMRELSLATFLVGYAGFLISNVDKYSNLHYIFVALFIAGFIAHACVRFNDNRSDGLSDVAAKVTLVFGTLSFIALFVLVLVDIDTLAFWAIECVGFTMMLLFTPLELIGLHSLEKANECGTMYTKMSNSYLPSSSTTVFLYDDSNALRLRRGTTSLTL